MTNVLTILIGTAKTSRDQAHAFTVEAEQKQKQSVLTLERLEQFRLECLDKSPAALGRQPDSAALIDYQRFLSRLDEAISLQRVEKSRHDALAAHARQRLLAHQRKVLTFEALAKRRLDAQELRYAKREQVEADEYAARSQRVEIEELTP